jgi:adenylate kinase
MAYYRQTSPLIGYYYAKGLLASVDGLEPIDAVAGRIAAILDGAGTGQTGG